MTTSDPPEVALILGSLWNDGRCDAILARFVETFLPGFHVDSHDFRLEVAEVVWQSDVRHDFFCANPQ